MSRITSYGFVASCQNLEKTNDTFPRRRLDRRKDGQTLFQRSLQADAGGSKNLNVSNGSEFSNIMSRKVADSSHTHVFVFCKHFYKTKITRSKHLLDVEYLHSPNQNLNPLSENIKIQNIFPQNLSYQWQISLTFNNTNQFQRKKHYFRKYPSDRPTFLFN